MSVVLDSDAAIGIGTAAALESTAVERCVLIHSQTAQATRLVQAVPRSSSSAGGIGRGSSRAQARGV